MTKKIITLLLVLAMVLSLAACSSAASSGTTNAQATTAGAATGKFKVAYIARTQSDAFAAELCNQFTEQAKTYSDTFTLDVFDSLGDSEKQNSLIEDCITKKYDCIIIQPNDGELQRPYCQKVLDAGIFCITTNAAIRDLKGASWVDGDPYAQGKMIMDVAVKEVPQGATVAVMNCLPGNYHTTQRYAAIKDLFLDVRSDIKVVADQMMEEASEASAMTAMEDWAQSYGKIDALLATADVLGLGGYEAVKDNASFKGMQVYSVDCLAKTVLNIKDGVYTAAVYQNPPAIAAANLEAAFKLLTKAETEVTASVDSILCTKDNVDKFIQMYIDQGQITKEEAATHGYTDGTATSILG